VSFRITHVFPPSLLNTGIPVPLHFYQSIRSFVSDSRICLSRVLFFFEKISPHLGSASPFPPSLCCSLGFGGGVSDFPFFQVRSSSLKFFLIFSLLFLSLFPPDPLSSLSMFLVYRFLIDFLLVVLVSLFPPPFFFLGFMELSPRSRPTLLPVDFLSYYRLSSFFFFFLHFLI